MGINNAAYEILRKGEVAKPEKEKARIAAAATANNSSDKQGFFELFHSFIYYNQIILLPHFLISIQCPLVFIK